MIKKIAHIGVAVRDIEAAERFYSDVLLLKGGDREVHGELSASFFPIGDTRIELLQSATPEGVMSKFIEKKGEGVHHIAYEVDDIEKALEALKSKGVQLIDEKPRKGAHNSKVAFINPRNTYGVLVELVEPQKKSDG